MDYSGKLETDDVLILAGIDPEAALNARTQRYVDHFTELEQTGRDNK